MKTTNSFVTRFIYAIQLLLPTSTGELIQVKLNTENGQVLVWGALSKFRTINERRTDISSLKLPPRHTVRGSASSHGSSLDAAGMGEGAAWARGESSWIPVELQYGNASTNQTQQGSSSGPELRQL